jgi:hypothetical protein
LSLAPIEVWCPTCHRREAWSDGERRVLQEGGRRRAPDHPDLAAWRVIARSRAGELGPVVARCPACGSPMVASRGAALPAVHWHFDLPEGPVDLPTDQDAPPELGARLETLHRPRWVFAPGRTLFTGCLISALLGPFLAWLFSIVYTTWFIANVFAH